MGRTNNIPIFLVVSTETEASQFALMNLFFGTSDILFNTPLQHFWVMPLLHSPDDVSVRLLSMGVGVIRGGYQLVV